MRSWITALSIAAAFLIWACISQDKLQGAGGDDQKPVAAVTLTNHHATGSFPISAETLAQQPAIVEITVSKVVNPAGTPMSVFAYLSRAGKKGPAAAERIPVGNFTLYPPDQPGKFMLRASSAFSKLGASSAKPGTIQLVLDLKRVDEAKPWTEVELTLDPPNWLRDK